MGLFQFMKLKLQQKLTKLDTRFESLEQFLTLSNLTQKCQFSFRIQQLVDCLQFGLLWRYQLVQDPLVDMKQCLAFIYLKPCSIKLIIQIFIKSQNEPIDFHCLFLILQHKLFFIMFTKLYVLLLSQDNFRLNLK